jgi:hypothetical protein
MINRLVYEVRLVKTTAKRESRWRWDVAYLLTTDPEYPGVETGRKSLGSDWGYEKFKWQAKTKISNHILNNPYKDKYVVR